MDSRALPLREDMATVQRRQRNKASCGRSDLAEGTEQTCGRYHASAAPEKTGSNCFIPAAIPRYSNPLTVYDNAAAFSKSLDA